MDVSPVSATSDVKKLSKSVICQILPNTLWDWNLYIHYLFNQPKDDDPVCQRRASAACAAGTGFAKALQTRTDEVGKRSSS